MKSHSFHVPISSGVTHEAVSLSEKCALASQHNDVTISSGVIHGAARSLEMSNLPEYEKLCSALEIPSGVIL